MLSETKKSRRDPISELLQADKAPNLTCVADFFALDFPGRTGALLHVAEVYSAPRLPGVVKAQVCGFVALFWKADVGKEKG